MASDDETWSSDSSLSSTITNLSDHMSECRVGRKPQAPISIIDQTTSGAESCKPMLALYNPSQSKLETLPVEIISNILSYLVHPRSRLPGLTEGQSAHDFPPAERRSIMENEDLTTPPDTERWAANLFAWTTLRHPFNELSLTSKRCHQLVESYAAHLVKNCNMFNLPFEHFDQYGPACVYPDLSGIVYRRLWLQHAPRCCIYCNAVLDCYPYRTLKRVIAACGDCFYRQTLTLDEVERQYHISSSTILASDSIRGEPNSIWVLRIDVEALALQLYGTRAFHYAHKEQFDKPCSLCAVTRFNNKSRAAHAKASEALSSPGVIRHTRSKRKQVPQRRRRWS